MVSICSACAAGAQAIGESVRLIRDAKADVMVAGGCEAPITYVGFLGFVLLTALVERYETPQSASRPFDRRRNGFVMSEGAGAMILESYEHARARGAEVLGEVLGYGDSSDAFRITDLHPSGLGAVFAMKKAIEDARLTPDAVDYINAHGTSTPKNDSTETRAIKEVFGAHAEKIPVSSNKSMIGHTIGAAGAVEAILAVEGMRRSEILPTINYQNRDPKCDLDYVPNETRTQAHRVALSNSFGSAGRTPVFAWAAPGSREATAHSDHRRRSGNGGGARRRTRLGSALGGPLSSLSGFRPRTRRFSSHRNGPVRADRPRIPRRGPPRRENHGPPHPHAPGGGSRFDGQRSRRHRDGGRRHRLFRGHGLGRSGKRRFAWRGEGIGRPCDLGHFFSGGMDAIPPLWPLGLLNAIGFSQAAIQHRWCGENAVFSAGPEATARAVCEAADSAGSGKARLALAAGVSGVISARMLARAKRRGAWPRAGGRARERAWFALRSPGCRSICHTWLVQGALFCSRARKKRRPRARGSGIGRGALACAGLEPDDVDLLVIHGRANPGGGRGGGSGFRRFGDHKPWGLATKGVFGHLWGGSPALDLIMAIKALDEGAPPTPPAAAGGLFRDAAGRSGGDELKDALVLVQASTAYAQAWWWGRTLDGENGELRFLFFDQIKEVVRGERIVGVKTFPLTEAYLNSHFSRAPRVPGSVLIEAMAQITGWLVVYTHDFRTSCVISLIDDAEVTSACARA